MQYWQAFDEKWFTRHQKILLFLLRFSIFRWLLGISDCRKIIGILPSGVHFDNENDTFTYVGRIHEKYSKLIYHRLKFLWWILHFIDYLVLDRQMLIPSFGFSTLTAYPDPHSETSTVDGWVGSENVGLAYNTTWASSRGAAMGSSASDNSTGDYCVLVEVAQSAPLYTVHIVRSAFLFDTSSLTSDATISSASLSVYVTAYTSNNSGAFNVYSSSPAKATEIAAADFPSFGTTAFSTAKTISGISAVYNSFALNASGLAAISKTGISKFGLREATYDVANSAPPEPGNGVTYVESVTIRYADYTGTSSDPKLEVVYTLPSNLSPGQRVIVVN